MRRLIEGLVLLTSLILALKWIYNPSGSYEPIIALLGLTLAALDYFFGKPLSKAVPLSEKTVQPNLPPENKTKPKTTAATPKLPPYTWTSSSDFFAERFGSAFPGIRTTTWFNGQDAVERLVQLLRPPLTFKTSDNGEKSPIWWFGRGNLQIEFFKQIDGRTVLINCDEHKISRLAAVYSSNYKRLWLYIETEPMQTTGLYAKTPEFLARAKMDGQTYVEEYAIFDGKHKITRSEYDDGYAIISGKITEIYKNCELRVRHLTPYNFLICPHDSPINSLQFDKTLEYLLDEVIRNPINFQKLESTIQKLPPRRDNQ